MNPVLTVLDFLKILYVISKNFPKTFVNDGQKDIELKCKRTNTFGVVYKKNQVNADNLEKDIRYKNSELFYSRHWEETQVHPSKIKFYYPAFLVAEAETIMENIVNTGYAETVTFNFMVLDKMPKKLTENNIGPCAQRTFEELGEDLKKIARQIFFELSLFGYFEFTDSLNNPYKGWFSSKWIEAQYEAGNINSYNCVAELSAYIQGTVKSSKIFEAFADDLAGFFANVTIITNGCEKLDWDYGTVEENTNNSILPVPDSPV